MPVYEFICDSDEDGCGKHFEISCSMNEISDFKPNCPKCQNNDNIIRYFGGVYVFDSSPRTVGSLAEKNAAKITSDMKEHFTKKHREKLDYSGSLPEGGSVLPKDKDGNKIVSTKKGKNFGRPENV